MKSFRLIRSLPASASYNMELDEKIFTRYLKDGIPALRVYRWQRPSFTYGVSQHPENEIDVTRCASENIGVAKRITGGGVLFHDDEITYSFVCSKDDLGEPQGVFVSYRRICAFLIRFYGSLGLKAAFAVQSKDFKNKCAPHGLCGASYEKYDIVINGRKIGGNAQKRRRQAVFQHGAIPCTVDWGFVRRYLRSLPENISSSVTTLSEELSFIPDKSILEQKLINAFGSEFGACFTEEESLYETSVA